MHAATRARAQATTRVPVQGGTTRDPDAGRRDPSDLTRARILATALALFAEQGYAATSTREIAEGLGFTKAALYYHFRTKEDLLAAIVEPAMDGVRALVAGASCGVPPDPRVLLAGYVDLVAAHADLVRVLADDPAARTTPALADAVPVYRGLVPLLAGTDAPDTAQRTRVRAALGAVHAALVRTDPGDDPGVVRASALAAACGALGLGPSAVPAQRPPAQRPPAQRPPARGAGRGAR